MSIRVGMKWDNGAKYIGRPTVLGNPFEMKDKSEASRVRAIRLYEVWLRGQINKDNMAVIDELFDILNKSEKSRITLGCYCKPKKCHGDIIKKFLDDPVMSAKISEKYWNIPF